MSNGSYLHSLFLSSCSLPISTPVSTCVFKLYLKGTTWSPEKDTLQCAMCQLLNSWERCSWADMLLEFLECLHTRNIQVSKLSQQPQDCSKSAFRKANMVRHWHRALQQHPFDQPETMHEHWVVSIKLVIVGRPINTVKCRSFIDISCAVHLQDLEGSSITRGMIEQLYNGLHRQTPRQTPPPFTIINMDLQSEHTAASATGRGTGNSVISEFFSRVQVQNSQLSRSVSTPPSGRLPGSPTLHGNTAQPESGITFSAAMYTDGNGLEPGLGLHSSDTSSMDVDLRNSDNQELDPFISSGTDVYNTATAMSTISGNITPMLVPTRAATLLQYADQEIMAKKLWGETKDKFIKWCSAGPDERKAALGAMIFVIMDAQHPVAHPQRSLYIFALQCIVDKQQWGLPANLHRQDEEKWAIIVASSQSFIINWQSDIKKAIIVSMDIDSKTGKTAAICGGKLHIYQLCKYLTSSLSSKSQISANITVTIQLCTRIAFLAMTWYTS
ncbi:uncharacterized protein TRAVEDRAFT_19979 [Trametes versicolor FP-101664 SS1]|uniref:uncharacterized protein n=1 Tax=Trametes versicolor (strain FP-101664) TaxID=717944 RepID=UPI0004622B01|nr:uncharacterized protein TRAVEDRAFT_19979 [Trametes versicolor FP-101664 SS1]EIW59635.1 hypothetical protein TRAVEDRAFT_19979 [Trametes versicolor FP-101664 SS1]